MQNRPVHDVRGVHYAAPGCGNIGHVDCHLQFSFFSSTICIGMHYFDSSGGGVEHVILACSNFNIICSTELFQSILFVMLHLFEIFIMF